MNRIRGKLTYANVISTLCLVLLLGGGTAYAAAQLGKNSVGSKQLKKGAVTPAKLNKASKSIFTGPKGATGAQGPKGDKGERGAPATGLWAVVSKEGELLHGTATSSLLLASVGRYEVTFGQDVSSCAMVITSQEEETETLAEPSSKNPNTVYVGMWTSGSGSEHSFSLAIFC